MRAYVRDAAGTGGGATSRPSFASSPRLRDAGTITPEEYEQAKAKVLA